MPADARSAADLPVVRVAALLRAGELGDEELIEAVLERVLGREDLGAWELVDTEGARAQARGAAAARRRGEDRPLLGLPLAVKDVIDVRGLPTRAGAAAWVRHPQSDAPVVARLRDAGAVVLGKTHTNEFAYGIDGRNPHRPACRNPHAPDRLTGGSSSGSAVAVAAVPALGALGTDTSGSLRVPAALCGVAGLRTSRGAVPRDGVVELAEPYDAVGPLAHDVTGLTALWAALRPSPPAAPAEAAGLRVGLLASLFAACTPAVEAATRGVARALADAGVVVEELDVRLPEGTVAAHLTIQQAAAARAHAGRYGVEAERYAPDVRERLERGRALGAEEVRAAEAVVAGAARSVHTLLERVDALLAPAAPAPAPPRDAEGIEVRGRGVPVREALLALPIPLTQHGGPVLAFPAGTVDGLPVGVQLAGRPGEEDLLLALACAATERRAPAGRG